MNENGQLYAWGQNHKGQLGTGDYKDYSKPKRLTLGDQSAAQVVALVRASPGSISLFS